MEDLKLAKKKTDDTPSETGDVKGKSTDATRWAKLDGEKRALKAKLTKVEADLEEVAPKVLAYFERTGISSIKVGKTNVHLRRELWVGKAEGATGAAIAAALRENGMADYVTSESMNVQSLSAWAREAVEGLAVEPKDLVDIFPEGLRPLCKVTEKFKVASRVGK